jgi:hypothetical protein
MNEFEIVAEYENRLGAARKYRGLAAAFLVLAVADLAVFGFFQNREAGWSGMVLLAGLILSALTLAFAVLSVLKLRCPDCSRILGEVYGASYCPGCGAALRPGGRARAEPPAETALTAPKASRRRTRGGGWEPRRSLAAVDDFPEEAYPKNIRMFTTANEMELTKRYIKLIDQDDRQQDDSLFAGAAGSPPRRTAAAPQTGSAPAEPATRWRRQPAAEAAGGVLSRLIQRIRGL